MRLECFTKLIGKKLNKNRKNKRGIIKTQLYKTKSEKRAEGRF